ncbi:uncharacterized protein LOC126660381 [Mercurialis annua]|uniref:uncharacterized protein LOC126660381 n=1 Tax=Mercurialis annua TaxID=3986 RepID=UPI0021603713|nr:uncharacterized protein LOC126660381 [Mercurialis annua]
MRCMKFPNKWTAWTSRSLSSTATAVLVNGTLVDRISPYLFLIVVECLKRILDKSRHLGFTQGFSYSANHEPILMLSFADDTILYLPFDIEQLGNLTRILHCFELISGLTINFHKSYIMGINVNEAYLLLALQKVGCKIDSFSIKYFGLLLSNRKLAYGSWDHVVEAVQKQLESYMMRFLLKGDISNCILSKKILVVAEHNCYDFQPGFILSFYRDFMNNAVVINGSRQGVTASFGGAARPGRFSYA